MQFHWELGERQPRQARQAPGSPRQAGAPGTQDRVALPAERRGLAVLAILLSPVRAPVCSVQVLTPAPGSSFLVSPRRRRHPRARVLQARARFGQRVAGAAEALDAAL